MKHNTPCTVPGCAAASETVKLDPFAHDQKITSRYCADHAAEARRYIRATHEEGAAYETQLEQQLFGRNRPHLSPHEMHRNGPTPRHRGIVL